MQVAGAVLGASVVSQATGMSNNAYAYEGAKTVLIDITKCTGCRTCVLGCKQWNNLPIKDNVSGNTFSSINWINIISSNYSFEKNGETRKETIHVRKSCMHCQDAACVKVCPAGAIGRTESGMVNIDQEKCIGCNYCIANCTFNVVGFDQAANVARKCTGCYDRIEKDLEPACVHACPTGALSFGDRDAILNLAESRIIDLKSAGYDRAELYGVKELDGLGMIYILPIGKDNSKDKYTLPEDPQIQSSTFIWDYMFKPVRVVLVAALGFALWVNRSESQPETTKLNK